MSLDRVWTRVCQERSPVYAVEFLLIAKAHIKYVLFHFFVTAYPNQGRRELEAIPADFGCPQSIT